MIWIIAPQAAAAQPFFSLYLSKSSKTMLKFVDRILSPDKTKEQLFRGEAVPVELNSGKSWLKTKHFGQQFNHSPSFVWGKRSKKLLKKSKAKFVRESHLLIIQRKSELEGKLHLNIKIQVSYD